MSKMTGAQCIAQMFKGYGVTTTVFLFLPFSKPR